MNKVKRFSMMSIAFILFTQLFMPATIPQAAQGGTKRARAMRVDPNPGMNSARGEGRRRRGNSGQGRCYRGCRRQYSRCLYWAGGNRGRRRACAVRYRNCVRRCG